MPRIDRDRRAYGEYAYDDPSIVASTRGTKRERSPGHPPRHGHRANGREEFKCGRCRAFVGPTISGGRHRNHCPLCLFSRHVDRSHPGDRASDCRSLMEPIGTFNRPNGEQMLVHRCLGCGIERHNRVAADDNPLACLRLPPVMPRFGKRAAGKEDEAAIA